MFLFLFLLECLGKFFLLSIPFLSLLYIIVYETTHFFHSSFSSFFLSGKIPLFTMLLVFMMELWIHLAFKRPLKKQLKGWEINRKIRRYKLGYWAKTKHQTVSKAFSKRERSFLFFTLFSILFVAFLWFLFRLQTGTRHVLSGIAPFFTMIGGMALSTLILSALYSPYSSKIIKKRKVSILMPIYNEPIENIRQSFLSILHQTIRPFAVVAVNDGSTIINYDELVEEFAPIFAAADINFQFVHQKNSGKRAAQLNGYKHLAISDFHEEIILTIDSDTVFEKHAIEQGIIPFEDENVYSVAGVIVTRNISDNILTIITDLLVIGHMVLIERSMNAMFGSVAVNSGPIAFYRAEVLALAKKIGYANETFRRVRVEFSDDSFLTMTALLLGRTVAQSTAVSYTDLPNTLSHHIRQHLRWSRGSFIRGFWRLALFPITSFVFFRQAFGWAMFAAVIVIKIQLLYWLMFMISDFPVMLVAPLAFSAVYSLSYISIPRNDLMSRDKWIVFWAFPFAVLWSIFILSPVRLWGYITHKNTGWGTREKIEL